jgi:hypothetical protein
MRRNGLRAHVRSATRIATLLGVLMTLWSSIGVPFVPREEEMAPKIPGVLGPAVAAVSGALIAALGWRRR